MKKPRASAGRSPTKPEFNVRLSGMYVRAGMINADREIVLHDHEKPSLQKRILDQEVARDPSVEKRFRDARYTSLVLCFRAMMGHPPHGSADEDSMEGDLAFWDHINVDPAGALKSKLVQRHIEERVQAHDVAFFVSLGEAINTALSNKRRHAFHPLLFQIARFWVHPDCPLWMMNNEAGSRFIEFVTKQRLSAENYAQLIKRYSLARLGRFPIRGVRINKRGTESVLAGFELSRWVQAEV